jgi:geranylgeranyl pyrophosphate synthase
LIQAMRRSLSPEFPRHDQTSSKASRSVILPGLCCQAAGGNPIWADDITAAWYLLYIANHLMDSVQDQDEPDDWWADLGPGAALGVATGLFFSATHVLNRLQDSPSTCHAAASIIDDFSQSFLCMSGGQYRDLTQTQPTLDQYWEILSSKSGVFFALACRCGARLATDDPQLLAAYGSFGQQVGILVQIRDDLQDLHLPQDAELPTWGSKMSHSLATVYALEVLPHEQRDRLLKYLAVVPFDLQAVENALSLIDQSGAGLYFLVEVERHRNLGLAALERTSGRLPAIETLASFLDDLCKK